MRGKKRILSIRDVDCKQIKPLIFQRPQHCQPHSLPGPDPLVKTPELIANPRLDGQEEEQ